MRYIRIKVRALCVEGAVLVAILARDVEQITRYINNALRQDASTL